MNNNIWYAFDYETSDTNPYSCEIAGLGIHRFDINTGKVMWSEYTQTPDYFALQALIEEFPSVMHNAPFDSLLFVRQGLKTWRAPHDTLLMAKAVNNQLPFFDLKSLSWHYFGEPYLELLKLKEWFRANGHPSGDPEYMDLTLPPVKLVEAYCLKDVEMTARLAHLFWKQLKDNYAYDLDRSTIPRTVDTLNRGLCADLDFYKHYIKRQGRRLKRNTKNAAERMNVEEGKKPMGDALKKHLKDLGETRTTETGLVATAEPVLRDWKKQSKGVVSALRIRKDTSSVSSYPQHILKTATPIQPEGRFGVFHIGLIQSGAVTRRYTARGFYGDNGIKTKGNPQNFPRADKSDMRGGIVARPGYEFWKFDLASIEARMFSSFMEILMGESVFADEYRADPWFNPYLWVIDKCTTHGKVSKKHELYTPYKHGVLGRLYCSGPARFAIQLKDDFDLDYSEEDCRDIYRSIDRNCPFIKRFQRFLLRVAEGQGYVDDPFGARYFTPSHKPYEIIAHLHQGSAANVFKWWLGQIEEARKEMKADDHVVNYGHDEVDVEMRKKGRVKSRVKSYCGAIEQLDIFGMPLRAEATTGASWLECN